MHEAQQLARAEVVVGHIRDLGASLQYAAHFLNMKGSYRYHIERAMDDVFVAMQNLHCALNPEDGNGLFEKLPLPVREYIAHTRKALELHQENPSDVDTLRKHVNQLVRSQ